LKKNILVTGAGGGIGQGVIKSLRMINDIEIRIIATDISELATGLYAADMMYLVSSYKSENYLSDLGRIFKKESIDYYIPGTDVELRFCAENKQLIFDEFNVHTIISSLEVINIADNKYETALFLKNNGFNYPETIYLKDADQTDIKYPVIVKPSVGARSIGVYKANSFIELNKYLDTTDNPVIQEFIGTDDQEYTCTVVKVNNEISPVLALKRTLRSGDTFTAEPLKHKLIEQYVLDVASKLEIDGGCNFQLRLDEDGQPKIFEINSRFSGTTPFCSYLGFNPVEFYLKKHNGLKVNIEINFNTTILRCWSEVLVQKDLVHSLSDNRSALPCLDKQFTFFK